MSEAWECAETDRPRYLRWVWEVSHLPFLFVALGDCRDAYRVKLARSWKKQMEAWCNDQFWLQERGNPNAWNHNVRTRAKFLSRYGGTDDDIEDGTDLMMEIGYYGISDEWKINTGPVHG